MDMNTMIIAKNSLTPTRMKVIANRTQSPMMAGAKAMLIEQLKAKLQSGVATFIYQKKDGSYRIAIGTTCRAIVEREIVGTGASREYFCTSAYWDIQAGGWRSFRWENIIAVL